MKVIKRNQLVILVIGLMLVTAGYLNFIERQKESIIANAEYDIADLGDATLVSSEIAEESMEETTVSNEQLEETNMPITEEDDYFTTTKLQRETMYSQIIENYQKMLDSTTISAEQKAIAQTEITKINNTKNAIMIAENLIKTKGFKNVIILVNEESVNVILDEDSLTQEQIAQVQNIIARELKSEIENIHISNK